jgi:prepilin-type N-terminal cleavage/methylation domain-containing protein
VKHTKTQRGMSLIEMMVASSVLLIALLGVGGANMAAGRIATSTRDAEAAALAQELTGVLANLQYTSSGTAPTGLFANTNTSNDTDITDMAGAMNSFSVDPIASAIVDHAETELPAAVRAALTPVSVTTPNTTTPIYTRYWTIAPIPDPLGSTNVAGVTIAAIVRYTTDGRTYKHVAVITTRFDPSQMLK